MFTSTVFKVWLFEGGLELRSAQWVSGKRKGEILIEKPRKLFASNKIGWKRAALQA